MDASETAILRDMHLDLLHDYRVIWIDMSRLSPELLTIVKSEKPPTEKMSKLLTELPKYCSMQTFVDILITAGQVHLVQQIHEKITAQCTLRNSEIHRIKIVPSQKLRKNEQLAHILQVTVYNTSEKKKQYNIRKKMKRKMRMLLKERKYSETFALVNAILDTERTWIKIKGMKQTLLHKSRWFKFMENLISKTSCPEHAESIFHARFAAALALDGHLDGAHRHVTVAMTYLDLDHCARWNVNAIYAFINILLQIYTNDKTRVCRGKIIGWILTCTKQAENLPDYMRDHWLGMLEMKKVFVYLGIGIWCQDICGVMVTKDDLIKANTSLNVIRDRFLKSFDDKRKGYFDIALEKCKWVSSNFSF